MPKISNSTGGIWMQASARVKKSTTWQRFRRNTRGLPKVLFLFLLSLPFIFPFWWMLTSSFKPINEILGQPTLFPQNWRPENFIEVFTYQPFARHYFNSLYIALFVTIGTLLVSSLAGYAFARIRFPGSAFLFLLLLSAMMMPVEVTIIPNFFLMKALGFTDTHVPLIILPIFGPSGVLAIFIMRQFFLDFPRELEEAAMIDGLNRAGIFWKIALPMARPALAAVAILTFLFNWNTFLEPLVFINDINLFTLPLSLNNYNDPYGLPLWHLQLAATTLSVIPIFIVYLIAQKQVTNTMALTGIK